MIADRARRQLDAVAHKVVLIRQNVQRFLRRKRLRTALRHGERIVAELQLAGLLANLIHREIDNPAELVAVLTHIAVKGVCKRFPDDARRLLRSF